MITLLAALVLTQPLAKTFHCTDSSTKAPAAFESFALKLTGEMSGVGAVSVLTGDGETLTGLYSASLNTAATRLAGYTSLTANAAIRALSVNLHLTLDPSAQRAFGSGTVETVRVGHKLQTILVDCKAEH